MVVFNCGNGSPWENTIPCTSHASWELLATELYVSLLVFVCVATFVYLIRDFWDVKNPPVWVVKWIGSPGKPPIYVELNASLRLAQLCASTTVVMLWIYKSYEREVSDGVYAVEVICCLVFIAHLMYALINSGMSMDYALGFEAFLDAFTITPLIMQGAGGSYLTVAYLRVYRMNTAFSRLAGTGVLDPYLGELSIALIKQLVATIMVIFIIGGTCFVFEGLGDIKHFADRFVDSNMGGISFFQMCYFAFMVMSTVGFGDYSPTTVFSRFFIFFATVGGILFFSIATSEILDLTAKLKSGLGKYRPKRKKNVGGYRGHILVMGGGVNAPNRDACEVFLKSLCRDEDTPEIVLMGSNISEDVKDMLSEHWASGIQWFAGSPLDESDLNRVLVADTSMVFYIADFNTSDTFSEDNNNIHAAAALQKLYPVLQYRLMAIEVQHLELAAHVGLNMFNVYAIDGLKAAILATSLKCPGFPTLVLNLGLPDIDLPGPTDEPVSPWLEEYINSAGLEPYGFMPSKKYLGMTFKDFAIEMGKQDVVVIAIQINGSLRLNPIGAILDEKSVIFAMASDQSQLDKVATAQCADVGDWLPTFGANRREGSAAMIRTKNMLKLDQGSNFASNSNNKEVFQRQESGAGNDGKDDKNPRSVLIGGPRKMRLPSMSNLTKRASLSSNQSAYVSQDSSMELDNHKFAPPAEIRDEGGHVVLALLYQGDEHAAPLYSQVEVIVNNLRSTVDTAVVIIGPSLSPSSEQLLDKIRNKYQINGKFNVFFVEGDVMQPKVLNRAFVKVAEQFLSLTPSMPSSHSLIPDRNNVLAQNILDNKLRDWKRADLAAVFDWCSPNSFQLMPDAPPPFAEDPKDPLPNLMSADRAFADKEPRCHYRYASGRVLPKPLIAGVYSMAYYTPGVLELFEALIDPSKTDQEARPWPMPVEPKFIGSTYSTLAAHLLESGAIPLGVLRANGPLPYVLSCTPSNGLELYPGDAVYLLASMDWAVKNLDYTSLDGEVVMEDAETLEASSPPQASLNDDGEGPSTSKSPTHEMGKAAAAAGVNVSPPKEVVPVTTDDAPAADVPPPAPQMEPMQVESATQ